MRPVEMDKTGVLAAAMHNVLDDRRFKNLLGGFSVLVELVPVANDEVLFGGTISGHIQINSTCRREFTIQYDIDGDIRVEVSYLTEYYQRNNPIAHIDDVEAPVEINFDKRSITYKHVHTLSMKNVAWDWQAIKGTAMDIIGMILGDKNS